MTRSKETEALLISLKEQGIRFNIETEVDHRVELHYVYERLNGRKVVQFVAELDGYGNVTEWGPYLQDMGTRIGSDICFNADGEIV